MLLDIGLITFSAVAVTLCADKFGVSDFLSGASKSKKAEDIYSLKIGYSGAIVKRKILISMKVTPHFLVCGLSGSGKSKMVELAVRDKNNVVILNAFDDDFESVQADRINGNENILDYLKKLLEEPYKRSEPLYVVIDEMIVLCTDKKLQKAIIDLLAIGRHYNIFVIGIAQRALKEDLKFKDLFNARCCFRQIEESSYRAILGYSPEDKQLNHREFYVYSDEICKGRTYDL